MKYSELRIPKGSKSLTLKHIKAVKIIAEWDGNITNRFMCELVASMTNKPLTYIMRRCDLDDVEKAFFLCLKNIQELNKNFAIDSKKPVPKYITVNSKDYELANLERPNMSFIVDSDQSDFIKDPVRLACMCYIPKGTVYGDMDESENLLHPISERYKDFEEHFPLELFMNLNGFFLRKYEISAKRYIIQVRLRKQIRKALLMIGYYRLTMWLKNIT